MKHIYRLIQEGFITFSEDAEEDFAQEEKEDQKEKEKKQDENNDKESSSDDMLSFMADDLNSDAFDDNQTLEDKEDDWFNEDVTNINEQEQPQDQQNEFDDMSIDDLDLQAQLDDITPPEAVEIEVEEPKVVKKIQIVDIVSKTIDKYDEFMQKVDLNTWTSITTIGKAKKNKLTDWNYVEDVHTLLNTVLGSHELDYVNIYNALFEKLSGKEWQRGLGLYSQINYGKPWITEGLFLLMYELSFDWASFLIKFFVNTPEINPEDFENDSFVRKFPNLTLLTYIAKLVTESEEFNKFMTDPEVFKLMEDENEYNLTMGQIKKKKSMIQSTGESLTYFANLVKHDYADIVVGVLNKLGVVVFLHNNCKMQYNERLNLISYLIQNAASRKPIPVPPLDVIEQSVDKVEVVDHTKSLSGIQALENKANDLLIYRTEAMLLLESNKENYIKITND